MINQFAKPLDQNQDQQQSGAQPQQGTQPQQRRQGSGRFTNIQQYLGANRGAGQQLAQGIGTQVQKQLNPVKKETETQASAVREGIQSAQNTLNTGQNQLGQLRQIGQTIQGNQGASGLDNQNNLGIQEFRNDPNFSQFQNIQAGQAINEGALNVQQQALNASANQLNRIAQQKAGLAGTEGGRFDLLRQTFGGNVNPQYTQGQQRLDQLFLQRQGAGDLRQQLNQNVDTSRGLQAQGLAARQDVNRVTAAEQGLVSDIGTQARQNEQDFIKMLDSFMPEVNRRREQEFTDLGQRLANMRSDRINLAKQGSMGPAMTRDQALSSQRPGDVGFAAQQNTGLTADDLKLLGVTSPVQTFNVFDELQGVDDVAARGRTAQSFQDVARDRDVADYGALADIMGLSDGERRLTQAGDLGAAVLARDGDANLMNRFQSAARSFDEFARNRNYQREESGKKNFAISRAGLSDILAGRDIAQVDRARAGALERQSAEILDEAKRDLQSRGFGRVLGTDGTFTDAFAGSALGNVGSTYNQDGKFGRGGAASPSGMMFGGRAGGLTQRQVTAPQTSNRFANQNYESDLTRDLGRTEWYGHTRSQNLGSEVQRLLSDLGIKKG